MPKVNMSERGDSQMLEMAKFFLLFGGVKPHPVDCSINSSGMR
jgi:hypothetical protein